MSYEPEYQAIDRYRRHQEREAEQKRVDSGLALDRFNRHRLEFAADIHRKLLTEKLADEALINPDCCAACLAGRHDEPGPHAEWCQCACNTAKMRLPTNSAT